MSVRGLHWYTVMLLYPPEICETGRVETYLEQVMSADVRSAIVKAKRRCEKLNEWDSKYCENFEVLAVFKGKVRDVHAKV